MFALQVKAQAAEPRDWEQLVNSYITKAALAHAPAKLKAMHSNVPNISSRMVLQSTMQPETDWLELQEGANPDSGSEDGSSDRQEEEHMSAQTCGEEATGVESAAVLSHVSVAATQEAVGQQLPDESAALPVAAAPRDDPLVPQLSQQLPQQLAQQLPEQLLMHDPVGPVGQVQAAVQQWEQLSRRQNPGRTVPHTVAAVSRRGLDQRGRLGLTPLTPC